MVTLTNTSDPITLVKANPARRDLLIGNLSDTTLYLSMRGEKDDFANRAWPVKLNGVFELEGIDCYKGEIFATVSGSSDVRVWES